MSSITYGGHGFDALVSAELLEPASLSVLPTTERVPGRPGLLLLGGEVEPLELRVRLFMDDPAALSVAERASVRATLRAWLLRPEGAELSVPGEPDRTWHDAVCTDVSDWSSLLSDGSTTVSFTCMDPIAYGAQGSSSLSDFDVGGTWPTLPTAELIASGGSFVQLSGGAGCYVRLEANFAEGDVVRIDFAAQTATVNGQDATASVALDSDFFALEPAENSLSFLGCSSHTVLWVERWA